MLHIITGPPAAGKTSFIAEHSQPGDIRIDLDHIANLLAGVDPDNHDHAPHVWAVAKAARTAAIDAALKHAAEHDVWVIDSKPTPANLTRYREHGAQIHTIDPGKTTVMSRIKNQRPARMIQVAAAWYSAPRPGVLLVKSFAYGGRRKPRGLVIDARPLPNPHRDPALRMLNGQSSRVIEWMEKQAAVTAFIDTALQCIEREQPTEVWVGCSAGKHRSVYVADQIAHHLGGVAEHTALGRAKTTTERGYGWEHQQQRAKLLRKHVDGAPCWWCGLPMHKDKALNWDAEALAADHLEKGGAKTGTKAQRLLHGRCNKQRQDGARDDARPVATGRHPSEALSGPSQAAEAGFSLTGLVID